VDPVRFLTDLARPFPESPPRPNRLIDAIVNVNEAHPEVSTALAVVVGAVMAVLVYIQSLKEFYLDFRVYFLGAHHLFNPHLYELNSRFDLHFPFTYPPVAAVFFWPLTIFPFRVAAFIWTTATIVALGCIVHMSLRLARPHLSVRGLRAATFLLTALVATLEPIWQNFHFGQVNIVLGAMTMYDVLTTSNRRLPRGILLGLATSIKLIPGIFILYLLLRKDVRSAVTAGATVLFLNVAAFAMNHHATIDYWAHYAFNPQHMGGVLYNSNQSIRGAIPRLAHHLVSPALCTALAGLTLLVGISLAVFIAARRSELAALVTVGVTGDLVSPISWSHHLIWFIPLLAWLIFANDRPRGGPVAALLLVIGCSRDFIWIPPHTGSQPLHWTAFQNVVGNYYFFAMVLTLLTVAWGWRTVRPTASPESR